MVPPHKPTNGPSSSAPDRLAEVVQRAETQVHNPHFSEELRAELDQMKLTQKELEELGRRFEQSNVLRIKNEARAVILERMSAERARLAQTIDPRTWTPETQKTVLTAGGILAGGAVLAVIASKIFKKAGETGRKIRNGILWFLGGTAVVAGAYFGIKAWRNWGEVEKQIAHVRNLADKAAKAAGNAKEAAEKQLAEARKKLDEMTGNAHRDPEETDTTQPEADPMNASPEAREKMRGLLYAGSIPAIVRLYGDQAEAPEIAMDIFATDQQEALRDVMVNMDEKNVTVADLASKSSDELLPTIFGEKWQNMNEIQRLQAEKGLMLMQKVLQSNKERLAEQFAKLKQVSATDLPASVDQLTFGQAFDMLMSTPLRAAGSFVRLIPQLLKNPYEYEETLRTFFVEEYENVAAFGLEELSVLLELVPAEERHDIRPTALAASMLKYGNERTNVMAAQALDDPELNEHERKLLKAIAEKTMQLVPCEGNPLLAEACQENENMMHAIDDIVANSLRFKDALQLCYLSEKGEAAIWPLRLKLLHLLRHYDKADIFTEAVAGFSVDLATIATLTTSEALASFFQEEGTTPEEEAMYRMAWRELRHYLDGTKETAEGFLSSTPGMVVGGAIGTGAALKLSQARARFSQMRLRHNSLAWIQKTYGVSEQFAKIMKDAAIRSKQAGGMFGFINRFTQVAESKKDILAAGKIGRLDYFHDLSVDDASKFHGIDAKVAAAVRDHAAHPFREFGSLFDNPDVALEKYKTDATFRQAIDGAADRVEKIIKHAGGSLSRRGIVSRVSNRIGQIGAREVEVSRLRTAAEATSGTNTIPDTPEAGPRITPDTIVRAPRVEAQPELAAEGAAARAADQGGPALRLNPESIPPATESPFRIVREDGSVADANGRAIETAETADTIVDEAKWKDVLAKFEGKVTTGDIDELLKLAAEEGAIKLDTDTLALIAESDGAKKIFAGAVETADIKEVSRALNAAKLARNLRVGVNAMGVGGDLFGIYMAYADYMANGQRIETARQTNNAALADLYENANYVYATEGAGSAVGLTIGGVAMVNAYVNGQSVVTALGASGGLIMLPVAVAAVGGGLMYRQAEGVTETWLRTAEDWQRALTPGEMLQKLKELAPGQHSYWQGWGQGTEIESVLRANFTSPEALREWEEKGFKNIEGANSQVRYELTKAYLATTSLLPRRPNESDAQFKKRFDQYVLDRLQYETLSTQGMYGYSLSGYEMSRMYADLMAKSRELKANGGSDVLTWKDEDGTVHSYELAAFADLSWAEQQQVIALYGSREKLGTVVQLNLLEKLSTGLTPKQKKLAVEQNLITKLADDLRKLDGSISAADFNGVLGYESHGEAVARYTASKLFREELEKQADKLLKQAATSEGIRFDEEHDDYEDAIMSLKSVIGTVDVQRFQRVGYERKYENNPTLNPDSARNLLDPATLLQLLDT